MAQIEMTNQQICSCALTLSLLSSKWKVLIIRELLNGSRRYNDLRRSVTGISQKMLSQSLKEMENDGLVHRKVYPVIPPKVEYKLTATGESLKPVIQALDDWGNDYIQKTDPEYLNKRFDLSLSKNQWLRKAKK